MNLLRSNEATKNFLALQQQAASPNVTFAVNDGATGSIVEIKVGRDNQTLQVIPLINTDFSALNDVSCITCKNKRYNSTATNWTVDSTNSKTIVKKPILGNA